MSALHTTVRFGDRSQSARLEELAATLNTPLAEAIATHAGGLANHDGDMLDVRQLGSPIWVRWHLPPTRPPRRRVNTHERATVARKSSRRPGHPAGRPMRTSDTGGRVRGPPAADQRPGTRDRDARRGRPSNRQIADRLLVSVRTAEGHLYRIFTKLGINSRDQLIHLLNLDRPEA